MGFLSAEPAAAMLPHQAWRLPSCEDAVLVLAIGANCVLILAPLRSALRAAQNELGVEDMVGLVAPTYMLFAQCFFWGCYGLCTRQPDIANFNAFGAVMSVVYLAFIARGARPQHTTRMLLALAVSLTLVFALGVALTPIPTVDQGQVFAFAAILFSLLQSLAPMYQAIEAVRSMSPAGFPLAVAASSCISSLLWAQYAVMVRDNLYFVSNALNALVGVSQLAVVGWVTYSSQGDACKLDLDDQPLMPRSGRKRGVATYKDWLVCHGVDGQYGLERAIGAYTAYTGAVAGGKKPAGASLNNLSAGGPKAAAVLAQQFTGSAKLAFSPFQGAESDDEAIESNEELARAWGREELVGEQGEGRRQPPPGFRGSLDCIL